MTTPDEEAGRPQRLRSGETIPYGLMRWPARTAPSAEDCAFAAIGIQGRWLHLNPAEGVVVAIHAAQPEPPGREPVEVMAFLDALVVAIEQGQALRRRGPGRRGGGGRISSGTRSRCPLTGRVHLDAGGLDVDHVAP